METSKVTFPMLSDAEIVESLKGCMDIHQLTVQNLTKPEPEFVYSLYESVVQKVMDMSAEEMAKPIAEPYNDLGFPQLYDGGIYQLNFIQNLFKVMRAASIDFKLSDLLAPTYQRTRRCLSAVINFVKYREDKFSKFEETEEEGHRLAEEQMVAEEANQSATAELAAVRAEVASEEPQMHELKAQMMSVDQQMEHWRKELEEAQAQRQLLDKKLDEYSERSTRYAGQIVQLEKSKADLSRRCIPHPEKELHALEQLRLRQAKEEELLANAQRLRADRTARRDHLEKSRKAVLKAVALCQDISEALDHVNAERKSLKDFKSSIATDENILRELDINQGRMQTQLDSIKDRTSQAQLEQDKMREEKLQQLDATRAKKASAEREHSGIIAQIKALDLEIAKLETEETQLLRCHDEQTSALKSHILAIIDSIKRYQAEVHNAMRETMQAQQEAILRQQQTEMRS